MALKPDSIHNPFQPYAVIEGKRSAIPEDFSAQDIEFFESALGKILDVRLNARLADILWLLKKPRQISHALSAIDCYSQFSLDHDSLLKDGKQAFERAIRLSLMIGKAASQYIDSIRAKLLDTFNSSSYDEGYRTLWLAEILLLISIEEQKSKDIAGKLEALSVQAKVEGDFYKSRQFLEGALDWHKRLQDENQTHRLTVAIAETWVSEAEIRAAESNMVAGSFYESAIKEYRKIPTKNRSALGVDNRIHDLHQKMNTANQLALGEMEMIEMPGIDISDSVEASRKHVSKRSFPEVLIALANIHSCAKVDDIRDEAEEGLKHSVFEQLCTSTHLTRDGRVARRSLGLYPGNHEDAEYSQMIWQHMLQRYNQRIELVTQACILPALQATNLEHRITEKQIFELCGLSHVVPHGRELLWAKGIYAGFENDFIASTHLLIPQIEHFVRMRLKHAKAKTSTLNSEGIETENGLSTLLDIPEAEQILGKDLLFEFKALLTDSTGPNLRNEVAHGLIEADSARSLYAIYSWWLALRLLINSIPWKRPVAQDKEPEAHQEVEKK
ncbi:MAG: hypothetical protein A2X46_14070 [Lentisphaerae bacterium GWF2_57_35]|nr:MAG: hypothetical protein A2X46_14070 [Lentisphaerae bacterium GWF2_57_35]